MNAAPLAGLGVLITRPAEQAAALCAALAAEGARPIAFPLLEIAPPADTERMRQILARADTFDWWIFVSPTAVDRAWPALAAQYPGRARIAAIGPGTARALCRQGVTEITHPEDGGDSERLLALPALQNVHGLQVLIVRGEGGRPLLGDILRQRGACVEYAECYRRLPAKTNPDPLLARWRAGEIQAVVCTSAQIVAHLVACLGAAGRPWLAATPLFVPHPRVADAARAHGFRHVYTTGAGDSGIVHGLREWFARRHD